MYRDDWLRRVQHRKDEADNRAIKLSGPKPLSIVVEPDTDDNSQEENDRAREAELLAYINHLPEALSALYEAERESYNDGPQQEQTQATIRVADALERMWLLLVNDFPDDRFPPNSREYIGQFRANRGAFHWALARRTNGWPGSMVVTMVGWSVLREMERIICDTVRALTRFSKYDLKNWNRRWERATFDSHRHSSGLMKSSVRWLRSFGVRY